MASEAEKTANLYYGKLTKELWVDGKLMSHKDSFIAGVNWLYREAVAAAQRKHHDDFRTAGDIIEDLKKLLGEEK